MSARSFVHQTLLNDPTLANIHKGKVVQGQALRTANPSEVTRPFVVHRFGNDTDENIAESDISPHRQFISIWFYDEIGDYQQIDHMVYATKQALATALKSKPDHIMTVIYLETSQDLIDETLNCICRYSRYQLVMS